MDQVHAHHHQDLLNLASHLRSELHIQDRVFRMKVYKHCFVGEQAVKWMVANGVGENEAEAVKIGNQLIQHGLLQHVTAEHAFENRYLFYRFVSHADTPHDSPSTTAPSRKNLFAGIAAAVREENSGDKWSLASEVARLQRQLLEVSEEAERGRAEGAAVLEATCGLLRHLEDRAGVSEQHIRMLQALAVLQLVMLGAFLVLSNALAGALLVGLAGIGVELIAMKSPEGAAPGPYEGNTPPRVTPSESACPAVETTECPWGDRRGGSRSRTHPGEAPPLESAQTPEEGLGSQSSRVSSQGARGEPPPQVRDLEGWPDRPVFIRLGEGAVAAGEVPGPGRGVRANVDVGVRFETELFEGWASVWVLGLESSPAGLFAGRRRKSHLVVQWRFKERVPFAELVTGQQFERPLGRLPAPWLLSVLLRLARRLSPSLVIGPLQAPCLLSPVVATAQRIHVASGWESAPSPGSAPTEDMTLLGSAFQDSQGGPLPWMQRKARMADLSQREAGAFETEHVYTFHFWQHLLDCAALQLDLQVARFALGNHLLGQPLQLMAQLRSSKRFSWKLELWHEALLGP